jgi:hypothetical protein
VDLFFIKKLPFLLEELVPLGLALCIPTKNRTAPVIAAGIGSFINTARSRDFDCVQLRTDGEGALAAMSEELSGLGIMLTELSSLSYMLNSLVMQQQQTSTTLYFTTRSFKRHGQSRAYD